ncbi:hypothetical protein Ddc_12317 [Ditylenchus destructor]|nr:hypothetical protein Ddc_12317 [Ditylenchus destructor]
MSPASRQLKTGYGQTIQDHRPGATGHNRLWSRLKTRDSRESRAKSRGPPGCGFVGNSPAQSSEQDPNTLHYGTQLAGLLLCRERECPGTSAWGVSSAPEREKATASECGPLARGFVARSRPNALRAWLDFMSHTFGHAAGIEAVIAL